MKELFEVIFKSIAGPLLLIIGFFLIYYTFNLIGLTVWPILAIAIALSPIWIPVVLFYLLYDRWLTAVRLKFKYNNGRSLLRIKLPQEVLKSPEAMESVMAQIHNPNNADNLWQTYLDGKHPLTFSFELVSIGGDVRFYANVPTKKTKNALESQLYAQYPGIEVTEETIDYAAGVVWNPKEMEMISFHVGKKGDEVLPIKTYIDYKLDLQPKEELKFEPMSPMIEHLGKVKPHEQIWIQFLMIPHAKKNFKTGSLTEQSTWEKKAQEKINEIMGRNAEKIGEEDSDERPMLTVQERDTVTAIQRNVSKYAYETAIRAIYITKTGKFDGDMISPLLRSFAQYDIIGRNGVGPRWRTDFDYNWFSDWSGKRKLALKHKELEAYKARHYEEDGAADKMKIWSVEELATMYHLPGSSVVTPGLGRVETTRREAPNNLPTGRISE